MVTSDVVFFFLVLILSNISVMAINCSIPSNSFCIPSRIVSMFPFRIKYQQPESCGYPGFSLTCRTYNYQIPFNFTDEAVLELPHSGEFFVDEIDYVRLKIRLRDPNYCLPKRLLDLNLSDSPFKMVYYQNYTFLNCTNEIVFGSTSKHIIDCLSTRNSYVVATYSMTHVRALHSYCEVIKTVPAPIQFWPFGYYTGFLSNEYWSTFDLTWDKPDCRYWEAPNKGCRLRNKNSHETRFSRKKGLTAGAISGISIGIGLPVLLGIIYCVAFCIRVCSEDDVHQPSNVELSNAISPRPIIPVISLNESVIDSYPKIVLGESRRLPKPDDNICPICLSEYLPKEILKIIPECNHNFHADCIDQWLHTNMTCPVCRNSPT